MEYFFLLSNKIIMLVLNLKVSDIVEKCRMYVHKGVFVDDW